MKYMGGKYMLKKKISSILKKYISSEEVDGYLEPFCGALNIIMEMNNHYNECLASDYHPDLIQLWKEVQNGTFICPTEMNETIYHECKNLKSPHSLKGFVGFSLSFGGKYFAGYADKYKNDKKEDFLKEATNSIKKIKPKIKNIKFNCCSYDSLNPTNKLIYCDPPYQETNNPIKYRTDTKKYDTFDNKKFWNIMRQWSENNYVFISETTAPNDFIPIWTNQTHRSASQSNKTRYKNNSNQFITEKLFIHKNIYNKLNKINLN